MASGGAREQSGGRLAEKRPRDNTQLGSANHDSSFVQWLQPGLPEIRPGGRRKLEGVSLWARRRSLDFGPVCSTNLGKFARCPTSWSVVPTFSRGRASRLEARCFPLPLSPPGPKAFLEYQSRPEERGKITAREKERNQSGRPPPFSFPPPSFPPTDRPPAALVEERSKGESSAREGTERDGRKEGSAGRVVFPLSSRRPPGPEQRLGREASTEQPGTTTATRTSEGGRRDAQADAQTTTQAGDMSAVNDRRWSLARATEFFSGDGKPDMYVRLRVAVPGTEGNEQMLTWYITLQVGHSRHDSCH